MNGCIPSSFEFTEVLWFTLRCQCGFESDQQSLGLVGYRESINEHTSYRVAWFDPDLIILRSGEFRLPIDIDPSEIPSWVMVNVVQPVMNKYGNCLYSIHPQPFETTVNCPRCETKCLNQFGEISRHRYIEYEAELTIVEDPERG